MARARRRHERSRSSASSRVPVGRTHPGTPSGCLSLFETEELFVAGMLLLALPLLLAPLAALRSRSRLGLRLSSPVRVPRTFSVRFRLTTALTAIAIVGLDLGWEINAWKTWRGAEPLPVQGERGRLGRAPLGQYCRGGSRLSPRSRPTSHCILNFRYRSIGITVREPHAWRRGPCDGDELKRDSSHLSAVIRVYAAEKQNIEWAAAPPGEVVAPDSPLPRREPDIHEWLRRRDYVRASRCFRRTVPGLPRLRRSPPGERRIRATCPDARVRDGELAVASATPSLRVDGLERRPLHDDFGRRLRRGRDFQQELAPEKGMARSWSGLKRTRSTNIPSPKLRRGRNTASTACLPT